MEHAVDAVTHPHALLRRLDVDVARAVGDRLAEQLVDDANHRHVSFDLRRRKVLRLLNHLPSLGLLELLEGL